MNRPSAWGSDWFLSLNCELRLAWQYIVAHADRGGFFEVEHHQHLLRLVCSLSLPEIQSGLAPQLVPLTPTLWQLRAWVPDQYPRDYDQKLNGVQVAVIKELKRRASQFGAVIFKTAFADFPQWPEIEAKPNQGGVDRGGPPDFGGSTGMARPGYARPGLPPPVSKDTVNPEYAKAKGADASPGVMPSTDQLVISSLVTMWQTAGYPLPDFPPFTSKALCSAAEKYGGGAVSIAAHRFLLAGGDNLTPKRFGNELGDWLRTVPREQRQCPQGHDFEGALLPRDDFENGPKLRVKRCSWCGYSEPVAGTVEASTELQQCAHKKTRTLDGPLASAGKMAGSLICEDCGHVLAGGAA